MFRKSRALLAVFAVIATIAGGSFDASTASATMTCSRVAALTGSDSAAGTAAAPFRTPQKLADSLAPGQTGCLRAGVYTFRETRIARPSIILRPYGDEDVTLRGTIKIPPQGAGTVIEGFHLNGKGGSSNIGPRVHADRVVLRGNEITNDHTEICINVSRWYDGPSPVGVVIEGNRIHGCGALPSTNMDHGIYLGHARGTVIRNNWIYDNADRGIQLYPDADKTTITGNVIDGNGVGVIFSGTGGEVSEGNVVENNLITNSKLRDNVESYWGSGPVGTGNVVRNNCIYGGAKDNGDGGIETPQEGFVATNNLLKDPLYVNRQSADYRLTAGSPCAGVLAGTSTVSATKPGCRGKWCVSLTGGRHQATKRVRLRGRVRAAEFSSRQVTIQMQVSGHWQSVGRARLGPGHRFRFAMRAQRDQTIRYRATMRQLGRSRVVRV